MYTYEKEVLEAFLENQEQLLYRKEFDTLEEVDEFLMDCDATICESLAEVKEYFGEGESDIYGMDDEELLSQSEVFALANGRYLIVEG